MIFFVSTLFCKRANKMVGTLPKIAQELHLKKLGTKYVGYHRNLGIENFLYADKNFWAIKMILLAKMQCIPSPGRMRLK